MSFTFSGPFGGHQNFERDCCPSLHRDIAWLHAYAERRYAGIGAGTRLEGRWLMGGQQHEEPAEGADDADGAEQQEGSPESGR